MTDGVTLRTRDGRELRAPMVIAADGVNSVIARRLGMNPGWPPAQLALDMMEETPVARSARGGARHAVGLLRLRRRARLRLHLPEARARQRRHRLRAAVFQGAGRPHAVRSAAAVRRRPARARPDGRRVAARAFHAVPDPDRRAAAHDGAGPGPARGRCRRIRQRLFRRGDLLRDGHRAISRARAPSLGRRERGAGARPGARAPRLRPRLAPRDRRASCATRSSSRSTCSTVPRAWTASSAARGRRPEFSRILVDYASGRLTLSRGAAAAALALPAAAAAPGAAHRAACRRDGRRRGIIREPHHG